MQHGARREDGLAVRAPAWPSPAARFVVWFVTGTAALLGLYHFPFSSESLLPRFMTDSYAFYARAAGVLAHASDPSVRVQGSTISGRFAVSVGPGCDAIEMMIPLVVAILAFPARAIHKVVGVLLAVLVVVVANIGRIASLYFAGAHSPDLFDLLHVDVWPAVLFAVCIVMFLLWARSVDPRTRSSRAVQAQ